MPNTPYSTDKRKRAARAARMRRLAEQGATLRDIAASYGISHQRVHQIVGSGINPRGRRTSS